MLEAVDGRTHLSLFRAIAPHCQMVFIDKPFAVSKDAREISGLAEQFQVTVMSARLFDMRKDFRMNWLVAVSVISLARTAPDRFPSTDTAGIFLVWNPHGGDALPRSGTRMRKRTCRRN